MDHAELGADILFKEGLIDCFPTETLPEGWQNIAETAICQHNKLALPSGLDTDTETLSNILRDADKVDIFRVLSEISYADLSGGRQPIRTDNSELSPEVMACVKAHRCVPSSVRKTLFDRRVSHCCLAFELVYERSRMLVCNQGNLKRMIEKAIKDANEQELAQLDLLRKELSIVFERDIYYAKGITSETEIVQAVTDHAEIY